MRRNGLDSAFHDSHSLLMVAFSAAFFSAKEGSPNAIWFARQAISRIKLYFKRQPNCF